MFPSKKDTTLASIMAAVDPASVQLNHVQTRVRTSPVVTATSLQHNALARIMHACNPAAVQLNHVQPRVSYTPVVGFKSETESRSRDDSRALQALLVRSEAHRASMRQIAGATDIQAALKPAATRVRSRPVLSGNVRLTREVKAGIQLNHVQTRLTHDVVVKTTAPIRNTVSAHRRAMALIVSSPDLKSKLKSVNAKEYDPSTPVVVVTEKKNGPSICKADLGKVLKPFDPHSVQLNHVQTRLTHAVVVKNTPIRNKVSAHRRAMALIVSNTDLKSKLKSVNTKEYDPATPVVIVTDKKSPTQTRQGALATLMRAAHKDSVQLNHVRTRVIHSPVVGMPCLCNNNYC
jgi:precorrin-4 methylase